MIVSLIVLILLIGSILLLIIGIEHAETKRVAQGRTYVGIGAFTFFFCISAEATHIPAHLLIGYAGIVLVFLGIIEDNNEHIIPEWAGRFIQIGIILLCFTAFLWFVNVFSSEPHLARFLLTLGLWSESELLPKSNTFGANLVNLVAKSVLC